MGATRHTPIHSITLSGNTAGALQLISSGTVTLAGGNNITLSQAGNAVTISGPNVAGAQTGISGVANSQTTYTSGTVSLSELGAITIRSTTGNQFQFSVNPQSVQPETQTFIGGISASDTLYTSGTVRLTGVGGGVTVSSNTGQRVDISVAAQSVQPETQTFIAGVSASDTLYTSGNVRITGVGGGITVSSNTGQRIDLSVAAQSVQPETQTFVAGIQNSQTTYTSGTVNLSVVAGNLTIRSTTGQAFQFSASQSPETQTAVSGIANSQTTYTSGTVTLSELGAITIRSTTGNQYQFSVNSQTVQTQGGFLSAGVSTGGNTAGNTQVSTGSRLVIVASGALTASQATAAGASTITLSAAAQSVQPETQTFIAGVSASDTLYTSGNVRITGVGGGITVSSNTGQRVDLSVAAPVAQTVQTQNLHNVTLSGNTAGVMAQISSGTMTLAGGNNITLSQNGNAVTISAGAGGAETQTAISGIANSQTTYTSGTVSMSELGAITIRSTTGNQYQFSVNAQSVQPETQTFLAGIQNSQTTYTSGTVNLSVVAGNLTIRSTTGQAFQFSMSQTVQPETQTAISGVANSQTTYTSGTVSLSELGAITIRSTTGNQYQFSVNSQTVQTQNVHNVTLSGNTAGVMAHISSGTMTLAGGNNITLSQNGNAVTISAPNLGAGAMSAGVSNLGNTAGATGVTGTQLVLVGSGVMSLSQTTGANGGTVSILAPATSSLSATGQVSISTNGSTISIGVPNPIASYYRPSMPLLMGATQGIGASAATQTTVTAWVMPMSLPRDLAFNNLNLAAHASFSSNTTSISSVNYSFSMGASFGFYTLTDSSMSLVSSYSGSLAYTNATSANVTDMRMGATVGWGGSSSTKSTLGGANMSAIMSSINSVRQVPLNWSTVSNTLTRGQYFGVAAFSALTAGAAQASLSQVGFESSHSILGSAFNPPVMMQNTASVTSPYPFLGQATLVNSSNSLMPVSFNTSVITTATAIANSTKFQSLWLRIFSSHSY